MNTNTPTQFAQKAHSTRKAPHKNVLTVGVLAVASIATSFAIGMQTAGDVQPFTLIEAGGNMLPGDINNDLAVNLDDVILTLEMTAGYTPVTPEAYENDPNQDGRLTIDDALSILRTLR
jgi:hypothetical protein